MATGIVTDRMQAKAEALADQVPTYHRGKSKVNGQEFVLFPSTTRELVSYYSSALGCTCEGFRQRARCVHQQACWIAAVRESEKRIAAAQRIACSVEGCDSPAFGRLRRCVPCFSYLTEKLGI